MSLMDLVFFFFFEKILLNNNKTINFNEGNENFLLVIEVYGGGTLSLSMPIGLVSIINIKCPLT